MNALRQRKLDARARRLEVVRGPIAEKTIVKVPQPKNLDKKEVVKVSNKSPKVAETMKRGRGRPRKVESENIAKNKKTVGTKKTYGKKGK